MTNQILHLLRLGAKRWNDYRGAHPEFGADDMSDCDEEFEHWKERTTGIVPIEFVDADLRSFDFSRFDLCRASFFDVDCSGARFEGIGLDGVHFQRVQLQGATFVSSSFNCTAFIRCNLDDARFVACEGLIAVGCPEQLDGIRIEGSMVQFFCIREFSLGEARSRAVVSALGLTKGQVTEGEMLPTVIEIEELKRD
jgi:uncharacterized protein YjbI with pentapeptide repeats